MRPLPLVTLCLAGLLWQPASAHAGDAPARGATVSSVREAERQRAQALNARDIEQLRRLIGGNYRHVETNGRLRSKTEFLQSLARDDYRIRKYELEDMDIELLGEGSVALVTGTYRAERQDLGGGQPVRGRYVRIWTRQPEGWRMALHQATEIRTAAAAATGADTRALQ
ncbi:nuclear transport factor 2 family protein [Massilia sp. 9I]|uniref:nuclear transport factor 2 family protein n=1 Tax=Massilia sp. 9I TaxID=2653152 RepID=UPI0012F2115D|nr:nuclear transport factor 2 family protein [Massilia sp. 9I]VXB12269.1 conserved exported hypothetical protein [Massilia sp. 9I]